MNEHEHSRGSIAHIKATALSVLPRGASVDVVDSYDLSAIVEARIGWRRFVPFYAWWLRRRLATALDAVRPVGVGIVAVVSR